MCSSCTGHLPHCTRGFFRTTKLTDLGTPALFLTLLVAISKQPAVSYLCLILFEGTSSAGAFWGKGSKHYEEKSHSLFLQSTWFWTHKFRQQPEIDSSVFWPARGRSFRCLWGRLALTALRGCLFLQVSSMLSLLLSTPSPRSGASLFIKLRASTAWAACPPWKSKACLPPCTWLLWFLLTSMTTEHFETDKLKIKSQQLTANQ